MLFTGKLHYMPLKIPVYKTTGIYLKLTSRKKNNIMLKSSIALLRVPEATRDIQTQPVSKFAGKSVKYAHDKWNYFE